MARRISVQIVGDSRQLERAFSRSSKAASRFNRDIVGMRRATRGIGSVFGGLTAGLVGGAGIAVAFRTAFGEMAEAQKVAADTQAVLESTGGVANVTAEQIDELATSLMNLTGVDDEAIKQSENLLLTFTKIRNEVGKGNDIFNQATKVVLDFARRFEKDVPSAAVTVGKALNDPIRGVTALSRAGVQFTATQRKTIKALVESGRVLDAQKIILRELNIETGGAAEAYGRTLPGKLDIFKQNLINLAGAIAGELTPQLTKLVDRGIRWVQSTENQERVRRAFEMVRDAIRTVFDALNRLADAVGGWKNLLAGLVGAWAGFKAAGVGAAVAIEFANVAAAAGVAAAWRAALISTGFGALAVVAGIAAAYIITHWEKVKRWFQDFWTWLKVTALDAAIAVVEPFSRIPSRFPGFFGRLGKAARGAEDDLRRLRTEAGRAATAAEDVIGGGDFGRPGRRAAQPRLPQPPAPVPARRPAEPEKKSLVDRTLEALRLGVDRAGLSSAIRDDLAALRKLAAYLKTKIRLTKDNLDLQRELVGVQQQIGDLLKQQAEQRAAAREARQFRLLGFGPGGEELVPGIRALKRMLDSVRQAVEGSFLDTRKTRGLLANIRRILSGGLGAVSKDVRAKIQEILADINRQLKEQAATTATKFRKVSADAFLASLGIRLTPEQMRRFRQAFATLGPGGRMPAPSGQFATAGVVFNGPVTINGVTDTKAFETELVKRSKQRAPVRRGSR
jgi:hypothetical protein